jgi:hypothetical protein
MTVTDKEHQDNLKRINIAIKEAKHFASKRDKVEPPKKNDKSLKSKRKNSK